MQNLQLRKVLIQKIQATSALKVTKLKVRLKVNFDKSFGMLLTSDAQDVALRGIALKLYRNRGFFVSVLVCKLLVLSCS